MGFIFHNKTFHVVNGYQLMKRQYVLKGTAPVLQNIYSVYLYNVYVLYRYISNTMLNFRVIGKMLIHFLKD